MNPNQKYFKEQFNLPKQFWTKEPNRKSFAKRRKLKLICPIKSKKLIIMSEYCIISKYLFSLTKIFDFLGRQIGEDRYKVNINSNFVEIKFDKLLEVTYFLIVKK